MWRIVVYFMSVMGGVVAGVNLTLTSVDCMVRGGCSTAQAIFAGGFTAIWLAIASRVVNERVAKFLDVG